MANQPHEGEDRVTHGKYLISVWLTDGCNLKCKYCFQNRYRPITHMNDETVEQTIKFINAFERKEGVAFFGGETLLRKKQLKRILAKTNAPKYFLTTNGTLLDDDILDWLELHNVHINLSLDGMKDTQDFWRDESYDRVVKNLPRLLDYQKKVGLQVLLLCVMESQLYRNVKHIKELGFNSVYINNLDPYSTKVRNEIEKIDIYKEQYRKVVTELHDEKTFHVSDFVRWKQMLSDPGFKGGKCGFHRFGLGITPTGKLTPCHRGPELPDDLSFGDVWNGIDHERMKQIRSMGEQPQTCAACDLGFGQCPIDCYVTHERFGVDPHPAHCAYSRAKSEVIREVLGLTPIKPLTITPDIKKDARLIVGTLVDPHKYYILPQFLKRLTEMQWPLLTDYYFILDADDFKTYKLIDSWKEGQFNSFAPYARDLFRYLRVIKIPTYSDDNWMDRITRGRDLLLKQALKGTYTHLMWLDSDIAAPQDVVPKLLAVNEAIAGALVRTRNEHTRQTWFNTYIDKRSENGGFPSKTDFIDGDIINVDATGCDCVILRRDVMEAVGEYVYSLDPPIGEDMGFCLKAKELGFKTKVHTGVKTRHIGISDIELKNPAVGL